MSDALIELAIVLLVAACIPLGAILVRLLMGREWWEDGFK